MNLMLVLALPATLFALTFVMLRSRGGGAEGSSCRMDLEDSEVAGLPDRIRLVPNVEHAPAGSGFTERMAAKLREQGFEDAGGFAIEGIPDVAVRLLAHRGQSMYATLWDHAVVGSWYEFSSLYPGGARWTFTTLTGSGLEGRPGHTVVRDQGANLLDLYLRACSERPMGVFLSATAEQAVADFENRYAQWMIWRRAQEGRSVAA